MGVQLAEMYGKSKDGNLVVAFAFRPVLLTVFVKCFIY